MTDTTAANSRHLRADPAGRARTARAEFVKITCQQSTWTALIGTFILTVVIASVVSSRRATAFTHFPEAVSIAHPETDVVDACTGMLLLTQFLVGALGAIALGSEHTTGAMRSWMLATPKRRRYLATKAAVLFSVILICAEASAFAALGTTALTLRHTPEEPAVTSATVLRCMAGTGLYLALTGLLGLALGGICRSATRGVIALAIVQFILPTLTEFLPSQSGATVSRFLPTEAGMTIARASTAHGDLPYLAGGFVLLGWVAFALAAAANRIVTSDL